MQKKIRACVNLAISSPTSRGWSFLVGSVDLFAGMSGPLELHDGTKIFTQPSKKPTYHGKGRETGSPGGSEQKRWIRGASERTSQVQRGHGGVLRQGLGQQLGALFVDGAACASQLLESSNQQLFGNQRTHTAEIRRAVGLPGMLQPLGHEQGYVQGVRIACEPSRENRSESVPFCCSYSHTASCASL